MDSVDMVKESEHFFTTVYQNYKQLVNDGGFSCFTWKDLELHILVNVVIRSLSDWNFLKVDDP